MRPLFASLFSLILVVLLVSTSEAGPRRNCANGQCGVVQSTVAYEPYTAIPFDGQTNSDGQLIAYHDHSAVCTCVNCACAQNAGHDHGGNHGSCGRGGGGGLFGLGILDGHRIRNFRQNRPRLIHR